MMSSATDTRSSPGSLPEGRGGTGTEGLSRLQKRLPTVEDLRGRARRRVPRFAFDFVDAGCGDDIGLAENRLAFDRVRILPRYGFRTTVPSTHVDLFGRSYSLPVGVSPMGLGGMIWPGSEHALARACQAARIPYVLATPACASIEEIGPLAPDVFWFQLYSAPADDYRISLDLARRAERAGAHVLVVTMDVPVRGKRPRDLRNGLSSPFRMDPRTLWDIATSPAWAAATLAHGAPRCRSFIAYCDGDASTAAVARQVQRSVRGSFDWEFVKRLRDAWPGPLVVKGVLHPHDALTAVSVGADGIVVSNHGGRVLDAAPASIDALPAVAAAVHGRAAVILDSGVRSGLDVARALACGADAAMAGRPFLFAVAALGAPGAAHAIELFADEIRLALTQLGCASPSATRSLEVLHPSALRPSVRRAELA